MVYILTWTLRDQTHERRFTERWRACDFKWRQQRLFGIISTYEEQL